MPSVARSPPRRPACSPDHFSAWTFGTPPAAGIGAWAEFDLKVGRETRRQRLVIAEERPERYLRERSDQPQAPYDVHWLLDPIGDGHQTALTIVTRLPRSANWWQQLWRQWSFEPHWRAAWATVPGGVARVLQAP